MGVVKQTGAEFCKGITPRKAKKLQKKRVRAQERRSGKSAARE